MGWGGGLGRRCVGCFICCCCFDGGGFSGFFSTVVRSSASVSVSPQENPGVFFLSLVFLAQVAVFF